MSLLDYVISAVGLLLLAVVLWRASRTGMLTRYPFFYFYLGYVFTLTALLIVAARIQLPSYALAYWWGAAIAALLRFFVVWEVFRQTFSPLKPIRQVVAQASALVLSALAIALLLGNQRLSYLYKAESFFPDLERKTGLIQACLLLVCLFLARYYAIPLGRNVWGMALGLGVYLSVSVMNFSALELAEIFLPFWRYIRPLSFIGMASLWAWALWIYAPSPNRIVAPDEAAQQALGRWMIAWREVCIALRRVAGL